MCTVYYGFFHKTVQVDLERKGAVMHELGVLKNAVGQVCSIAEKNGIERIKFMTLEVGTESTFVPAFFEKLFPVATDGVPLFEGAELKMIPAPGKSLIIKEIGY